MRVQILDIVVFFVISVGTILFGVTFARKNRNVSDYTSGGGNMPGFIVGMSIFATFVSSISFLALPGSAYLGNWNSFVFSLSIPIAMFFAAKYFVPFYRNIASISAYSFLEERFGYWARAYAAICYLLTQIARIGSILFLLGLALNSMLGWSIPSIIIITGIGVVIYSVLG
ncbi:MAG: sodium:solute symporter, partial [Dysgonamonadaceae bacterium]